MKIKEIIFTPQVLDKLIWKHNVSEYEIRQALRNRPKIRLIEKGDVEGEDLYAALSRTDSGRYLTIFFIYKESQDALIISARDMDAKERRRYARN